MALPKNSMKAVTYPTQDMLRPLWARVHQIARQFETTSDGRTLKKADFSFLINLAREAEFKFYWRLAKPVTLEDAQELLDGILKLWLLLRTREMLVRGGRRKVKWDKPLPPGEAMDVFREEARRQVALGIEIVRQVLDTPGLFSEDPQYPGVTRVWLEELTKTLAAEADKLDANEATIAVIGTMKAGKSTVINAVVGSEVVPSRDQPMTTFPTRVVHVPGKLEPELSFPLARGFNALVRAIRDKDEAAAAAGEDLRDRLRGPAARDLIALLDQIRAGKVRFPTRIKGHDFVHEILGRTNDITRLAVNLDVDPAVATPERLSFADIPSLEIEFEHLATLTSNSGGRFALVDTPGPNEAGRNERLRKIVRRQLAEASGIILVLNYNELGSSATEDLVATLEEIPPGQAEQLTILANRFDQRGANSLSEEMVARFACDQVETVMGAAPENLAERVYPTSARFALRAHQARRAVRLSTPIDPEVDGWAREFADVGFGVIWRGMPQLLAEPRMLEVAVAQAWQQSGFDAALERTLIDSARNATLILLLSALGKLRERSEPLLEMLNVRDSAFLRSLAELEALTKGLQSDMRNLDNCLAEAVLMLDAIEAEIGPQIRDEVDTLIGSLRKTSDKFLKTGRIEVKKRRIDWLTGWFDIVFGERNSTKERFETEFEGYENSAEDEFWALGALDGYGRVICDTKAESTELSNKITTEINNLFKHFVNNGGKIIDRASQLFIERAHHDVASLFGKEWQSVQDRLQEVLDLEISAPKPLSNLVEEDISIRGGSFTSNRRWTETRWENIEGQWLERAASRFMRWWDGRERDWGRRKVEVKRNEYYVDVKSIRAKALEMADELSKQMNAYLQDVLAQLRAQTERYSGDVQTRVQSINTYILEELRRGSDQSEASLNHRKVTARLAAQARDLISEATQIRAVIREKRDG